jgi:O-antigen ligase
LTHWLLLALILASVVRSPQIWRFLFNWQLGIALLLSLAALAQVYGVSLFPSIIAKCRVDATLGNPSFLAFILVMSILVAAGFLARSFLKPGQQRSSTSTTILDQTRWKHPDKDWAVIGTRVFWFAVMALGIFIVIQTGTRAGLLGLVAGALAMPFALLIWGNRQALKPLALTSGGILLAVGTLYTIDQTAGLPVAPGCENQTASARLTHLANATIEDASPDASFNIRLASVKAGLLGFAERPVFGWGPENFGYVFDRHVEAQIFKHGSFVQDKAHNQVVEELATRGIIGALAFLFMWAALARAVLRRRRPPGEEALAYGILGALAAYFVQNLFLFDTPAGLLYWVMLAGWAARQEREGTTTVSPESGDEQPEKLKGLLIPQVRKIAASVFSQPWSRRTALSVVVALVGFSLYFLNYQPYLAARSFGESSKGGLSIAERLALSEKSFHTFPAMANLPRRLAFLELASAWDSLSPDERKQAYVFFGREAGIALSADPYDAPLLISSLLFIQFTTQDITASTYIEPMLRQLWDIAPNRAETHQIMANQALWRGKYAQALRIADEYEARAPGTYWAFVGVKLIAQENLRNGAD